MSWSISKQDIPKADVEAVVGQLHRETSAYQHEPHRKVMDALTACAATAAAVAPDGVVIAISSSGHYQDDGTGSFSLQVSQYPPSPSA